MIDPRLDRIEDKIDRVLEAVATIPELRRRTEALETALEPIQRHVIMIQGGVKLLAILGGVIAFLAGLARAVQ